MGTSRRTRPTAPRSKEATRVPSVNGIELADSFVGMLSDNQIRELVMRGIISVKYAALPDATQPDAAYHMAPQPRAVAIDNKDAVELFESKLVRSRLALTVGPLLKVMDEVSVSSAHRFRGNDHIVDLRKCPNGWALPPKSCAVMYTNECIGLHHEIVGLIVPRASALHNGLSVATSYVDSTWCGVLKLQLMNISDRKVNINLGMEVGRLFFFRTLGASAGVEKVRAGAAHFSFEWPTMLKDGFDPFVEVHEHFGDSGRKAVKKLWLPILMVLATAGIFAGVASTYSTFRISTARTNELWDEYGKKGRLGSTVEGMRAQLQQLQQALPYGGHAVIVIEAGQDSGSIPVELQGVESRPQGVFVQTSDKRVSVNHLLTWQGRKGTLVLSAVADQRARTKMTVDVSWMVIP